ncbi:dUTPase/dCTP pyrophosphatase [Vibrio phage 1.244.A._10N.261.54.C3]|nr:dUTPase/dCTP pyrophosphatase [Vibrio phage 1.244.A._10N.261.54.C3]AUR98801.1 dUTPase/dCTP pyrophosphatase [Vibrio phage 1.255.O._10N.286.45.F1]
MKHVTPLAVGHLIEILRLQVETNELYDPQWRSNNTLIQFKIAANNEYTEMADEIETVWKWYTPNPTWEPEKALFELVDIVHFSASCILLPRSEGVEDTLKTIQLQDKVFVTNDLLNEAYDWWLNFNQSVETHMLLAHPCECLCYFVGAMLELLGFTQEQYMQAHYKKNARNRLRATGGVIQGNYDKSTETELTLGA